MMRGNIRSAPILGGDEEKETGSPGGTPAPINVLIISDFLTHSFNRSGDVEKGVVAKKGLPSGNLNENSPQGRNFKTLLFSVDQEF